MDTNVSKWRRTLKIDEILIGKKDTEVSGNGFDVLIFVVSTDLMIRLVQKKTTLNAIINFEKS